VAILSGLSGLVFTAGNLICKNITELYTESIPFLVEGISTAPGVERMLSTMLGPTSVSNKKLDSPIFSEVKKLDHQNVWAISNPNLPAKRHLAYHSPAQTWLG
jgi:hypothetical protein